MTKIGLILAVLLFPSSISAQQSSAPLGLHWSDGIEITRSAGIEATEVPNAGEKIYSLSKLPQALSDQQTALGFYGYDDHLRKLVVISKKIENDPYGSAVLVRYSELSAILSEKYGKGASVHRMGDSIYAEQRYFVSGLNAGRISWFTNFKSPDLTIQIGVIADDPSSSRWRIIYENNSLQGAFEKAKRSKEKGSL